MFNFLNSFTMAKIKPKTPASPKCKQQKNSGGCVYFNSAVNLQTCCIPTKNLLIFNMCWLATVSTKCIIMLLIGSLNKIVFNFLMKKQDLWCYFSLNCFDGIRDIQTLWSNALAMNLNPTNKFFIRILLHLTLSGKLFFYLV